MDDLVKLIDALVWPITSLVIFFGLKEPIISILNKSNDISIKLSNGTELKLGAKEAEPLLKQMLEDIDLLLSGISNDEIELFTKIYTQNENKTVEFYFPDFKRGNEGHNLLRSLRERRMIEPVEGSTWRGTKHPKVTKFGSFMAKHRTETVLIQQ